MDDDQVEVMKLQAATSNPKPAGADFSDMLQDALTTANACFMAGTRMTGLASAIAGSESLIPDPRSRERAALDIAVKALIVAEAWMKEAKENCEDDSSSTLLPRGYPQRLAQVRRAITRCATLVPDAGK